MALVTREWITNYINTQSTDRIEYLIGRACLVLARNQTLAERMSYRTLEINNKGFNKFDVRQGMETAHLFAKFEQITQEQFRYWTTPNDKGIPRIAKYHRQLNIAAEENKLA